jgi:predicted alpha/beta hydrolase family esterase
MPNKNNAVYEEWKIWFSRLKEFLLDDVVLVGHSLGGIFLAKYLSENIFAKKIKAVFLVAAPFDHVCPGEFLVSFQLPSSLKEFSAQAPTIYLLFSKNDPIVPYKEAEKYHNALPGSHVIPFEAHEHFNQASFPELVKLIKQVYNK